MGRSGKAQEAAASIEAREIQNLLPVSSAASFPQSKNPSGEISPLNVPRAARPPWAPPWRSPSPRRLLRMRHLLPPPRPHRWCPPWRRRRRRRPPFPARRSHRRGRPRPTTGSSFQVGCLGYPPFSSYARLLWLSECWIVVAVFFFPLWLQLRCFCTPLAQLEPRTSARRWRGWCLSHFLFFFSGCWCVSNVRRVGLENGGFLEMGSDWVWALMESGEAEHWSNMDLGYSIFSGYLMHKKTWVFCMF